MVRNVQELRALWGQKSHAELKRIGLETGVPYGTIVNVVKGRTEHPRIDTFSKLADYAERNNGG